jgi:chitinase
MLTVCRPDDDIDVVYLAPEVYEGTPAQCTGPCQLVFPPQSLPSPTTISIPPYVTSMQIAPGTTTTITVTVPVIQTESIEYYNVNITSGQEESIITPTASISIRPFTTMFTLPGGETQVRTFTLPPWPAITIGGDWPTKTSNPTKPTNPTGDDDNSPLPPYPSWPITEPPEPEYTDQPGDDEDADPTIVWPSIIMAPVPTPVSDEGEDPEGDKKEKTSCKIWFFWVSVHKLRVAHINIAESVLTVVQVCIDWVDLDINIQGWEFNLPEGIWGP